MGNSPAFYLIDPSDPESARNEERFKRMVDAALSSGIRNITLVSARPSGREVPFLEQITAKAPDTRKSFFFKRGMEPLLKARHCRVSDFSFSGLIAEFGKNIDQSAIFAVEDAENELANSGEHFIRKMVEWNNEKNSSALALKKIPFSEVGGRMMVKGNLISPGEYRITSLFQIETPLQSASNIALLNRFLLSPLFFKIFFETLAAGIENPFLESLDLMVKRETVQGFLPFAPILIR